MADGKETTIFGIDLDSKEFMEKALNAKESIEKIGDSKNLTGLTSGLMTATSLLGVLGVAALALRVAFESVFETEKIEQVNRQFELLTENIGVSGEKLKESLVESSKGMATEVELLQSANKAMVEFGGSATQLGQIMNIARAETSVFGGTLLGNFELINQAIATGQTRALKHIGIIVDQQKAYRDYAKELGITTSALSDEEKQHAMLNAVLEKGGKNVEKLGNDLRVNTLGWAQLKTALKEIAETATVALGKLASGPMQSVIHWFKEAAEASKLMLKAKFGEGIDADKAKMEYFAIQIDKTRAEIKKLQESSSGGIIRGADISRSEGRIAALKAQLTDLLKQSSAAQSRVGKAEKEDTGKEPGEDTKGKEALEKRKLQKATFERELTSLTNARIDSELQASRTLEQAEYAFGEKRVETRLKFDAQIAEIKAKGDMGDQLTAQQSAQLIEQIEAQKTAKLIAMEEEITQVRIKAREQELQYSNNIGKQMGAQAALSAAQSTKSWQQAGKLGGTAMKSFENQSVSALQGWASGTKTAAEAAKGFMFGMIGDVATAQGKVMMLDAFKTFPAVNIPEFGAGAALVALGGFLGSQGGGGAAAPGGSAPSGTGGLSPAADIGAPSVQATQQEKKSVSINVQGSYFETEQTKTRLVEMIRESADATDFSIKQIGQ